MVTRKHDSAVPSPAGPVTLEPGAIDTLIRRLREDGFTVVGPKRADGAIVYDEISGAGDLPTGWIDEQEGGSYRLRENDRPALFDYVVGPHSWKRFLFPPQQRLWHAERSGDGFRIHPDAEPAPKYAFIGVRSCELNAIAIQDRVFDNGPFKDPVYQARRGGAFLVAVNCARPANTCFCVSMDTGPTAESGFDLVITELWDDDRHRLLIEAGSERGTALLDNLNGQAATTADIDTARDIGRQAVSAMKRAMPSGAEAILKNNLEHPRWDDVANRCLTCGNCTMVCPTCFCSTVEDTSDLEGHHTERWRHWDSCFTMEFSYIHGGSIRRAASARYRQWLTHKLAHWHDQFGTSGCVGCGRCITWCPVAIDITEEVAAIGKNEEAKNDER